MVEGSTGCPEPQAQTADGPAIYELVIERFRGIESLVWHPARGVNVILGGGDVGKSTILDALGLLLSPTNPSIVPGTDFYRRDESRGFVIETTVSIPPETGINYQLRPSWPWAWDGTKVVVPSTEDDGNSKGEPVYRLRVRGTEDLELVYEIVQPDNTADPLSLALRRAIGLVRLSSHDHGDRDLRLVYGSALDRLLSDKGLRSRLASETAKRDVKGQLTPEAKEALSNLDVAFREATLPCGLNLELTGGPGLSVAALIGLTADRGGVSLPLASWGTGTRRIATLTISEQNQGEAPITLIDEVERGLEPYRQRSLVEKLQVGRSQVFMTTHSQYILAAALEATLWYVDATGKIGLLEPRKTARARREDPEVFLSRLTVVAEGASEVGFVITLLENALEKSLHMFGVHVSDGGGQETTLDLLEALAAGGLLFAGFADNEEGKHASRWGDLASSLGPLLFRWASGCLEENVINAIHEERLLGLIADPNEDKTGKRLRTLADRLGIEKKDFATIKATAGPDLRNLIIAAAMGHVPATVPEGDKSLRKEFKAHGQDWFKTRQGGRELAEKVFTLGAWETLGPELLLSCNAVRTALGLPERPSLTP
jgi:putative ATP-dependent endonuclease of OLD family